jgi:hypothetical protein
MIPIKVCRGECGRRLPATFEFFSPMREKRKDGSVRVTCRPRCRECARVAQRQYSRRFEARLASDPERAHQRAARRHADREYSAWRRQTMSEETRESARASRRRLRKQPARLKEQREKQRMANRLRREREEGVSLAEMKVVPGLRLNSLDDQGTTAAAFERLPAWPLAAAIMAEDQRRHREHYAGCLASFEGRQADIARAHLNVPGWTENAERNVRSWAVGERVDVQFDVVDRVLTALEWCWWEVYNERTVRKHSLMISYRQTVASRGKVPTDRTLPAECGARYALDRDGIYGSDLPVRAAKYVTARRERVGDEGPDLVLLERVRHAFECTGYPSCATCRAARESEQAQMVLGEVA